MELDSMVIEQAESEADSIVDMIREIYILAFLRGHEEGWARATFSGKGTRVQRAYDVGFKDGVLANHDGAGWEEIESFMDLEQRDDLGLPTIDS